MGIVQAQKDISSYYIIGYYSANEALDGRFRRIKIALKDKARRRSVAKLDYRQGYYASKEFGKLNTTDKERQLAEALMLGDPVTDIDIAVEIDYFRLARDRYFVPVVAKIPGSELELAQARRRRIHAHRFYRPGEGLGRQDRAERARLADVKLKGQTAADLAKHPLEYDTGFTLAPGKYNLKFLARENETGKMGTYEINFVIPDLTTDQKLLPISSVILSSQRIALDAAVFSAEKGQEAARRQSAGGGRPEAGAQRDARLQQEPGDVRLPGSVRAGRRNAADRRQRGLLSRQDEGVRIGAARSQPGAQR
jgi:hypothetical protein